MTCQEQVEIVKIKGERANVVRRNRTVWVKFKNLRLTN